MINLILRCLLVYFFMVFSMKLLGKRQVGQMQMSELVTAFFLSELATYSVTDLNVPLIYGVFPIFLLICLEVIITFFTIKNPVVKKIFDFAPTVLIQNGVVLQDELLKSRLTLDELFSLLRLSGFYNINHVRFAILEPNGQLSVIPHPDQENLVCADLGIKGDPSAFSVALIDDGRINQKALKAINRDQGWLEKTMKEHKIKDPKDIFLLSSDFNTNIKVIWKEKR